MMMEVTAHPLTAWESYYVIVGSSAAALTGLMFVVIALVAEVRTNSTEGEISAFGTPTVNHFCAALLVSAILSAPWESMWSVGVGIGVAGAAGVTYVVVVAVRARRQSGYTPVLEDWLFHAIFPFAAYAAFMVAGFRMVASPRPALFGVGAAVLLLIFVGIHNAWDTVTFLALRRANPGPETTAPPASPPASPSRGRRGSRRR